MGQGYSLHIGLNRVDATAYSGWPGTLSGCVNDANSMQAICIAQGFSTQQLLNDAATADALLSAISALAATAASGDTVVISYSGHGGQVPDTTGTEDDGLCETWVCYDRMLVDKELYAKWSDFRPGVHIEVYSDSCHSGTVIRELLISPGSKDSPAMGFAAQALRRAAIAYTAVYGASALQRAAPQSRPAPIRAIPPNIALSQFTARLSFFTLVSNQKPGPIQCGVVLISACQDNQTAADGTNNGLFTEKLLQVWNNAAFTGTLPQFFKAISALMPAEQTPNFDTTGATDEALANGIPLTVLLPAVSSAPPTITGPVTLDRTVDDAPQFQVEAGAGRNYIVEVTTDPGLFADATGRSATNFYGSWASEARQTAPTYMLPSSAWQALKSADRLYYRAGSSTSLTAWDNYLVSTTDADAASAQYVSIGDASTDRGTPTTLSVSAPATFPRSSATGPVFQVSTVAPYFVVELSADPRGFTDASVRTSQNFYGSYQDPLVPSRLSGTIFILPTERWKLLKASASIFYRVISTTGLLDYPNYQSSTPDPALDAPRIQVV